MHFDRWVKAKKLEKRILLYGKVLSPQTHECQRTQARASRVGHWSYRCHVGTGSLRRQVFIGLMEVDSLECIRLDRLYLAGIAEFITLGHSNMPNIPPVSKAILLNGIVIGEVPSTGNTDQDAETVRAFLKEKGLHKEVTPFQAVFNQAIAFANTSAQIYAKDFRRRPHNGISAAPFVVNAAFSIELYIKALAQKHGTSLRGRGHELVKLHQLLPSRAHIEINQVIPQCAANRALGEPPNFHGYLQHLNDAFVKWRYSYELERTSAVHIEPTIFVMEVLHEACRLS